jgi:hypothetical protein
MKTLTKRQADIILAGLTVSLLIYTAIRAALLSITWDEAYTYIEFARNGKVFLEKYDMMSANNHILNTWLVMVFTKLFGLSEFVMRIPSLFSHLLFLFFSARLLNNFENKWLTVFAFIVLNLNPYLLDFFSLARGYGLSMGLMMASLYYFYCVHGGANKSRNALFSLLFASLAVFASFVLLNYCLILYALLWIVLFAKERTATTISARLKAVLKGMVFPTFILFILLMVVLPVTFQLKAAGALFFGGESGFWSDTISTITERCFYDAGYNHWFHRMAKAVVFSVLLFAAGFFLIRMFKKQLTNNMLFLGSMLTLLSLCSLSTIIQHHMMGTPYLIDRTALFLVVLFNLIFIFFIAEISRTIFRISLFLYASSAFLIVHFAICLNLDYVLEWRYDANTKEMLSDLEKIKKIPGGKETLSIGIPLIFDPAINFYREKNNLTWLNTAWRNETNNMLQDYFCLTQQDLSEFNPDSIEIIKEYPGTKNILAKPKYPPRSINTRFTREMNFEKEKEGYYTVSPSLEYASGFSYIVSDSITPPGKAVLAFYADVMAPDISNDNLILVLSFQHADGDLYSWQKAYVKDYVKNEKDWFRTSFTCIVPAERRAGDEIKAYIWNPDKHNLYIKEQEMKWLEYIY